MYQIGTYLVKTGHGVCRIDGIQSMAIPHSHETALYYRMTPLEENQPSAQTDLTATGDPQVLYHPLTEEE